MHFDAWVFALGPWLGRIFPEVVGDGVRPSRQEVHYFGPPAGSALYRPPSLPIWVDFATRSSGGERVVYGFPDVHGRGFKMADDTRGETVDPDTLDRRPSAEALAASRDFLARRFPGLAEAPLVEARVCQYENSPDGDLILDRHPEAENVWLAGGGSGHRLQAVAGRGRARGRPRPRGLARPRAVRAGPSGLRGLRAHPVRRRRRLVIGDPGQSAHSVRPLSVASMGMRHRIQ